MTPRLARLSRRDLFKGFGVLGFMLTPISRAMGYLAADTFVGAPRFVMFFKGGSFHPASTNPKSIDALAGTPIEPLQPHAQDLILFKGMSIHGGSPKSDGYKEEHGAGLIGCVTGNSYHYSKNDSYYAFTDNESIDIAIANHYKTVPSLAALPFASLHIGAGAQSDADNVGLGQRYISYRKRQPGDAQYGNAVEPVQDAGQLYDTLMQRVMLICSGMSNQPMADNSKLQARSVRIIAAETGVDEAAAEAALERAGGELPVAIVALKSGRGPDDARRALAEAQGIIAHAVAALR